MARYDLTDFEWKTIQPLLPNKPRGVPRVDDRRVLNGIFWVLRSGSPWADLPDRYGPPTTIYNRFNRWRKAGVWDRLMDAIIAAHDGKVQMIDFTSVRVHQQAAAQKNRLEALVSVEVVEDRPPNCTPASSAMACRCSSSSLRDKPTTPQWRSFCSTIAARRCRPRRPRL